MLTTASQFTPRARPLHTSHATGVRILRVAGIRHRQQSRGFRFGLWSKYVDDDLQREIRRRQRILIHKYTEHINKRLLWDKHPFAEDARHTLKRMMNTYWHIHRAHPGARPCSDAERHKQRTPENKDGVRPGQNIEDVERGAMEHLIFGQEQEQPPRGSHSRGATPKVSSTAQADHGRPIEQGDFVIDPITNRKVAKHPNLKSTIPEENIPFKSVEDHGSWSTRPNFPYTINKGLDALQMDLSTKESREERLSELGLGTEYPDMSMQPSGRPDPHVHNQGPPNDVNTLECRSKSWKEVSPQPSCSSSPLHGRKPVVVAQTDTTELEGLPKGTPKNHDSQRSRLWQYPAPDLSPKSAAAESPPQKQTDGLGRHKTAADKAHEQFEDLNPPSEDLINFENEPWLAEQLSKRIEEDFEPSPVDQHPLTADKDTSFTALDERHLGWHNEHSGKPRVSSEDSAKPEVHIRYRSFIEQLGPDDSTETTVEDLRRKYGQAELEQHSPLRCLEPGGKQGSTESDGKGNGASQKLTSTDVDGADEAGYEAMPKTTPSKKGPSIHAMEALMEQHERMSDAEDREATLAVKSSRANARHASATRMTGNFVRDFPEEFERSWTQTLSSVPTESTETDLSDAQVQGESMDGGLEGAFGRPLPSKIQPALDRHLQRDPAMSHDGLYSKGSEGPGTPEVMKCASDTTPSLSRQYGGPAPANEASQGLLEEVTQDVTSSQDISSSSTDGPTLYKILAYDPTMQKVNVAETTSLVPDFTSALSPADALLRLSHPTKFFPHFAALEAQGFEIVSGSGDVLIFRKVRPSTSRQAGDSLAENKAEASSVEAQYQAPSPPINPIDMTGRPRVMSPASANFASPTGYVNYENLPENEASNLPPPPPPPPSPRVKYNIDLRREEPVYSGPKHKATDGRKHKSSLGKRLLVGGVWVAGISYGLGVVSEYFTTGGMDGLGPRGF